MKEIVLASASPRRKELLSLLELPFIVEASHVDESYDANNTPAEIVMYLSQIKAQPLFDKYQDKTVIGSDTIVVHDQKILGKPKDDHDAFSMLKTLSGKTHQVLTGVTIQSKDKRETFYSEAQVTFYQLTDQEINDYITSKEPFDKAGAYGIQGKAAKFVKAIQGDYYTIVGLPVGELYQRLKLFR
jgi:septum formation protein